MPIDFTPLSQAEIERIFGNRRRSQRYKQKHKDRVKESRKASRKKAKAAGKAWAQNRKEKPRTWVMIDGEGRTVGRVFQRSHESPGCVFTGDRHLYTTLCYYNANGEGEKIVNELGLTTEQCLEFIVSIPAQYKIAAYGFGYDITKILEDLPAIDKYHLTHQHLRAFTRTLRNGKKVTRYHPIVYKNYVIDLFNTRFRVGRKTERASGDDWRTIHDIVKFYQCRFVKAVENWGIGTREELDKMTEMKNERRNLVRYSLDEILEYSKKECMFGAELADKLERTHIELDVDLRGQFYGAGSSAKAFLRKWNIKPQIPQYFPPEVTLAAAHAFFGGRFEIGIRGIVHEDVYDRDISAAYPYQITFLPCLLCGSWTLTKDLERVRESQAALVHYYLREPKKAKPAWGPFPFRDSDGSIPYPIASEGGWIHKDEFLAGLRLFPRQVRMIEAWVYETTCTHQPFSEMPKVYRERLRLGKEAKGMVLKYGTNAVAGSIMQTVGSRPYYCAVWAGMITSGCRAQLLDLIAEHEQLSDVIMTATDGLWSLKKTKMPLPRDTGTFDTAKPLGGWEESVFEGGVFMARPGIYFPMSDEYKKELKARGIGTSTLYQHKQRLLDWYHKTGGKKPYFIADEDVYETIKNGDPPWGVDRFIGIRGAVRKVPGYTHPQTGECAWMYRTDIGYGLWSIQHRMIDFDALPKRENGDGRHLETRRMPRGQFSAPYAPGLPDDPVVEAGAHGDHDDDQGDYVLD